MGKTTKSVTTNDDHLPHHSTWRLVAVAATGLSNKRSEREDTLLILLYGVAVCILRIGLKENEM